MIDGKCGECFRKEMKCCLQQIKVYKFFLAFRARITMSGSVSESEEWKAQLIIVTHRSKRKGSHFYWQLMPKRQLLLERSGFSSFLCFSFHLCPHRACSIFIFFPFPSSFPVFSYPPSPFSPHCLSVLPLLSALTSFTFPCRWHWTGV